LYKNMKNIQAGKRWQGNPVGERLSRTLQTASLSGEAITNPLRARSRVQAARSARISAASAEAEKSEAVRSVMGNDDLLNAGIAGGGSDRDTRNYLRAQGQSGPELEQNVQSVRNARRALGKDAFEDFAAANIAGTGTGYGGGPAEMFEAINRVAGGDRARATRILNSARGQAERAKRVDLYGAGFGTSADQLQQLHDGHTNAASVNEIMTDETLAVKNAGEIGGARNGGLVNMMPAIQRRMANASANMTAARAAGGGAPTAIQQAAIETAEHQYKRTMAHTASLLDVAGSVSPQNAQVIGGQVMGQTFTPGGPTVGQQIEGLRADTEFQQYRREYSTGAAAAGAAAGAPPPPTPSDIRLKNSVKYLKTLDSGIKLYSFKYIWGGPTYIGVVAQDLLESHPEAIYVDHNGYYSVDYNLIGVKMIKLEN
jgi:hypothetical protein